MTQAFSPVCYDMKYTDTNCFFLFFLQSTWRLSYFAPKQPTPKRWRTTSVVASLIVRFTKKLEINE